MQVSKALVELPKKRHALYRFFDRTDALLYVGITMGLPSRVSQHRKARPWWSEVQHMTVEWYGSRQEALEAEARAIREEKPLYNLTHNEQASAAPNAPDPVSIDGTWLDQNWHRVPPIVRDRVEVPAYDAGRYDLADSLLGEFPEADRHLFMKLGREQGERDGEDGLDGPEAKTRAVRAALDHLLLDLEVFRDAVKMLCEQAPFDLQAGLEEARGKAEEDGWPYPCEHKPLARDGVWLAVWLAERNLARRPSDEQQDLIARAAQEHPDDDNAARMMAGRLATFGQFVDEVRMGEHIPDEDEANRDAP